MNIPQFVKGGAGDTTLSGTVSALAHLSDQFTIPRVSSCRTSLIQPGIRLVAVMPGYSALFSIGVISAIRPSLTLAKADNAFSFVASVEPCSATAAVRACQISDRAISRFCLICRPTKSSDPITPNRPAICSQFPTLLMLINASSRQGNDPATGTKCKLGEIRMINGRFGSIETSHEHGSPVIAYGQPETLDSSEPVPCSHSPLTAIEPHTDQSAMKALRPV